MKKFLCLIVLGVMGVFTFSLSANTVLIATENSRYKNDLVSVLASKIEENNMQVQIVDHTTGGLNTVNPDDYVAVYVLYSSAKTQHRSVINQWLDSVAGKTDNVILHSTQRAKWSPNANVDTLTSASKRSNIRKVTDTIMMNILSKN